MYFWLVIWGVKVKSQSLRRTQESQSLKNNLKFTLIITNGCYFQGD